VLPVLQALIGRLDEMGAVPTMGLFRAPGSFSELEVMHQQLVAMENEIGAPNHVLRDSDDVHTIAALLLRWVRESRGPLLPPPLYPQCAELAQRQGASAQEDAMAVRSFVADLPDDLAKPLLLLTDFLRRGGPDHLLPLAELFVPALFRPLGRMGSERDAVEFTARLMGKVPPAQLDTDLPPMPEADTTEEEMGLSPIPGSPPNSPGSPPRSPPVKRRPKRRATGMFSCW